MERMQQSAQDAPAADVMSESPFLILSSHQLLIQEFNAEAPRQMGGVRHAPKVWPAKDHSLTAPSQQLLS